LLRKATVPGRARLALALLFCGLAIPARAQTDGRFAVGAQISSRVAPGDGTHGAAGVALLWRIGHSRPGFGWDWGLNWYSAQIDRSGDDGSPFELGELHVRPVMAGYGYTWIFGRTAVEAGALGGYAFTTFQMRPAGEMALRRQMGVASLSSAASNIVVVKPQVIAWHDLSKKIGLNMSLGYMLARPRLTISTPRGDDIRRLRADVIMFRIGLVYSVY
jgi:hypothetical protein